jgi:hypothetical protein
MFSLFISILCIVQTRASCPSSEERQQQDIGVLGHCPGITIPPCHSAGEYFSIHIHLIVSTLDLGGCSARARWIIAQFVPLHLIDNYCCCILWNCVWNIECYDKVTRNSLWVLHDEEIWNFVSTLMRKTVMFRTRKLWRAWHVQQCFLSYYCQSLVAY